MSIEPIIQSVVVKASPGRAFDLFTGHMADWWPKGKTIAKNPHVAMVMEPVAGGRWFERDADGAETNWGKVLAWQPPERLLLAWQISCEWGYDPEVLTEVEVTFQPATGGGTLVTLAHRNLERFGDDAARHADRLRGGWPGKMDEFAAYADAQV